MFIFPLKFLLHIKIEVRGHSCKENTLLHSSSLIKTNIVESETLL